MIKHKHFNMLKHTSREVGRMEIYEYVTTSEVDVVIKTPCSNWDTMTSMRSRTLPMTPSN